MRGPVTPMPDDSGHRQRERDTPDGSWIPIPDPTILTTEAVDRATAQFRRELNTLRELMETRMTAMNGSRQQYLEMLKEERASLITRIQTVRDIADRDRETLQQQLDQRLTAMQTLLDQRYAAQSQAFSEARSTALDSVRAALASAEAAVTKAETATEKRFESVNEFRQSLADQTSAFMTRDEVNVRIQSLNTTTVRNAELIAALELRLTSRLDTLSATRTGASEAVSERRLSQNAVLSVVVALIIATGVIVSILTYAHH